MKPSFSEALQFWWKLGWISFGGPTGQIAIMHRELVERRKWIDEERFLHALNYCMLLPGPEAQQLSTYLGWKMHGIRGGVCAGVLFVLPAVFILWLLSVVYVEYGTLPIVAAAFHGLVPAVIAIVFHAMIKLRRKTLHHPLLWMIAAGAAAMTYYFRSAYPFVVLGAGLLGWLTRSRGQEQSSRPGTPIRVWPQIRVALVCVALWLTPVLTSALILGWESAITREGLFFSKAALVTFGGAYAVLPYVAQHAVEQYHWLRADQMMHGFGLAETTPGPLIMVLQFVGFMGAWNHPATFASLTAATLGSLMTTWVTFTPSFLFILAGAPYVDRLIEIKSLQPAMRAVSAAVVGVMAQFAIWFALHAVLQVTYVDWFVAVTGVAAFATLYLWQVETVLLIAICALLGIAQYAII